MHCTSGVAGYKTLASNILLLHDLSQLSPSIKLDRLDDGDGLEATLIKRQAKYHKTCSLKYNNKNVQRATKRKSEEDIPDNPEKFTRRKMPHDKDLNDTCIFCNQPATPSNSLRNASTGDLDTKVRQCAINLQDQPLLAKLSRDDIVAIKMKYHAQCLVSLYNRDRALSCSSQNNNTSDTARNTAFAELVSYRQGVLDSDDQLRYSNCQN